MAVNIGPRIGIDGEAEYRKQINNIIQQTKTLKAEMTSLTSAYDKDNKSLTQNANEKKLLTQQIEAQKNKVAELTAMMEKSAATGYSVQALAVTELAKQPFPVIPITAASNTAQMQDLLQSMALLNG